MDGNRGRIEWPVEVAPVQYFLMAFADTAVGQGLHFPGSTEHNTYETETVTDSRMRSGAASTAR